MSHPVRVRGLKQDRGYEVLLDDQSHPVRVRGLKRTIEQLKKGFPVVAPRAGAWVETKLFP